MSLVCALPGQAPAAFPDPEFDPPAADAERAEAVLAGGCFWCTEAVYRQLEGVLEVVSGYSGGSAESANYEAVCSHTTEHAEAIRIAYQPQRLSYGQLLKVFFSVAHDPTQIDRQGEDVGRQYRSAIFHADAIQREIAQRYIAQLDAAGVFDAPIATRLEPLQAFYPAEAYHQDYAARHPDQPFIRAAAQPKVAKLRKAFPDRVRPA